MRDAWRTYLELALGLTEASRKKVEQSARSLVGKGGATAAQLQAMVDDVLSAGTANRDALTRLVRVEVDRALGAVGLAKAEEVAALNDRLRRLEQDLEQARARAAAATAAESVAEAAVAQTTASSSATGPAESAPVPPAPVQDTPTHSAAELVPAKKAVAKKTVAKKVAKKAVAKKAPGSVGEA
ncbi:hypothetical protein O7632_20135 [Solwaraspora sp. WMMD406]|uniref:phasin family protein n=1 Tax=Solwaraspora sp. WMMD406 TaxID=3016095 RepID=UPI002416A5FD|nr:hypothetical protein [Solwaraspora sp. WMMD406]MDG4766393.1 hypothetical protein [Solwaraspora sp. WMMD406]